MNKYLDLEKGMKKNITIGIVADSIENGGVERQTSLLLNFFHKVDLFKLYLFTRKSPSRNEYRIYNDIHRICFKNNLI